jgi:hypothetical protein
MPNFRVAQRIGRKKYNFYRSTRRHSWRSHLAEGELEGPEEGSDEELEESPLLQLGLLEGDEEGCAET